MGFKALGERVIHQWRAFALVTRHFESPRGEEFERTFLRHPGAVGIVAIDGDEVLLVRQFRPALNREMLEIPAGTLDKGDGETALACARRELAEEVGATAGQIDPLIDYATAAGISDEWMHLFVASDLEIGATAVDGIEEEEMAVERLSLGDIDDAIARGDIADSKTIIGLLLARQRM